MRHYLNLLTTYSGKKNFLFLAVTLGMLILYVPDSRAFDCSADSFVYDSYVIDADLRSCGDNLGLPQNGIAFGRIDTSPGGSGSCGFTPIEFTAYVDGQTVSESSLTASLTNCGFIRDGKYLWLDGSTTVTFSFEVNEVVTSISLFISDGNPYTNVFSTGAFSVSTGIFNNNADLTGLSLSSGTLSPTFDTSTTSYTASVANSVSSITVTPTASEANATVTVNGTAVTSGSASGSIALNVGSNTITTVVTAQDGVGTSSYVLTIHRADEDDLCDLLVPFDGCKMTPTGYKVFVTALGLCETAPILPTTTSSLDFSNCVLLYDKIGVDGVVVELAGVGYSTGLNADFTIPSKGAYRYAVVGLGQAISVKRQMEFPNPVKGRDGSVGRYCVTAHSDTYENWSTCSNSGFPEAGYSTDILYGFGASESQYSLGFGQNITAYAMTNDYRISTSQGATSWILGYQQFDAPLVIDESINSLDIAFTVSKGMELYDADSGSDYEVAPAPGEFSFQISVR